MAELVPDGNVELPGAVPTVEENPGDLATQPPLRLKGRKRIMQSLQRISSSPSLARLGRIPGSGYRSGGKGSISCVSLSPSSTATPYGHSHHSSNASNSSTGFSTAATSMVPTPGPDSAPADQSEDAIGVRFVQTDVGLGGARPQSSIPLPADLRPGSKGTPLAKTSEDFEGAANAIDYFSKPTALARGASATRARANFNFWNDMPDEINMAILRYLPPREIVRCSAVSRSWHKMCFDGQLWTSLDASEFYREIPPESLAKIITSAGPFVKDLNLRGCVQLRITPQSEAVNEACQNLENVCLEGCHVERTAMHYILLRNSNLVHLNLSGLSLVNNATCKIISQQCKQLEFLNVNWCYNMDARGVRKVIDGCPKLADLRVNECRGFIDKQIMVRLFETNNLERLIMNGCSDIRDDNLKVLFEGIDPEICPLTRRAMVPPRKLRHLDISKQYYLTEKGMRSLVGNVPDLEGLQLGGNTELNDAALEDLLPTVPRLTHLDLEELSLLTNETPKNLAKAPCKERLEHVSFSYCEEIGDTGMLPLLKSCRNLKNIDMDNTRVSDLSLVEAASIVRSRSRRSESRCQPEIGLRIVIYDCQNITWTGIREVISRNAEIKRASPTLGPVTYPTEVIQLKCFYGWQMTVDEHIKRVLRGDFAAASRLERKWAEYMMANEEAGAIGAGSRRRRRRAREAAMLHADEEGDGAGTAGIGRRRRARSGGCLMM